MTKAEADATRPERAELALRRDLARGEGALASVGPVLRHILSQQQPEIFSEMLIAQLRGMLDDIARQLLRAAQGDPAAPLSDGLPEMLAASLAECEPLVCHCHALAIEARIGAGLAQTIGLDPVCPPLVQALIGSAEPETAALGMGLLAAQARFVQTQARMQLPIRELPGELLHAALLVLRAHLAVLAQEGASDLALAEAIGDDAEARLRESYDESATRLALHARMVSLLGAGAVAALDPAHAGVALFLTALAMGSGQTREACVIVCESGQQARLALCLRAAGQGAGQIATTLLTLRGEPALPEGLATLSPERAAAILAHAPGPL